MPRQIAALIAGLSLLTSASQAQQLWDRKPSEQWSAQECRKLLQDSPWSQRVNIADPAFSGSLRSERLGENESVATVNYVVQFISAPVMRQAAAQQALLAAKGKAASEQEKVRAWAGKFLAVSFANYILVHVSYGTNMQNLDLPLALFWQRQTSDTVKDMFALIGANGRRVAPVHYEPLSGDGREFEVTFPRLLDGQPLVAAGDKKLVVEFIHPPLESSSSRRVALSFPTKNMVRNGEVVY